MSALNFKMNLSRWIIAAIMLVVAAVAYSEWTQAQRAQGNITVLLVPESMSLDDPQVRVWKDAASEEGVLLQPMLATEWAVDTSRLATTWAGVIMPDTFFRKADDGLLTVIRSYVAQGGKLMLVFDAATLTPQGNYATPSARLSALTGTEYALYEELRDKTIAQTAVLASADRMEALHIPPGRFTSRTGNLQTGVDVFAKRDEKFAVQIAGYGAGLQTFSSFATRGRPNGELILSDEQGGVVAARHRYQNGETLFVNLPLTYLKQRTDSIFLHGFLRYFAVEMLGQPQLAQTPRGIGSVVLNWHCDAKPAIPTLERLEKASVFEEGPYSFHFTAGPDVNQPGDAGGMNLPANTEMQAFIKRMAARGHAIGSHGGWMHNYFGRNINETNESQFKQYLELNHQAISALMPTAPREYSAPMGNQPKWVNRWLEQNKILAYYTTGNMGMGPTRTWLNSERDAQLWAFPVLTLGMVATAEDAYFQKVPVSVFRSWLLEVANFIERERTIRLVYFHPPGAVLYLDALNAFVEEIKKCRLKGTCQWLTMTQTAQFLNRREKTQWSVQTAKQEISVNATNAEGLEQMAWTLEKRFHAEPKIMSGDAVVESTTDAWRIVVRTGKSLSFKAQIKK